MKTPDIALREPDIVRIGGACFVVGTITSAAGFTICVAPKAAQIVFAFGLPLVVMPPDVTHKAQTPRARVKEMRRSGPPVHQAVASPTDVFERFDTARYGSDRTPLHDPCVIACLLEPSLFHARHINVQIETKGEHTLGMTVAEWWCGTGRAPNAMVIRGVDRGGFYRLLTERFGG